MSNEPDHVAWHIADDRSAWALCGRTSGVVAFDENSQETIQVDLMPLFMGTLRLPKVDIKRFLVNAPYNSPSEHDSSLSSIDSPLYKGRRKLAFEDGEVELMNPLDQLAQT